MARRPIVHVLIASVLLALAASLHTVAATRNFLWKVTSKQSVVYLVGSVHLLTPDFYPLGAEFDTAFTNSTLLVEELDLGETTAPSAQLHMLTRGMLPAGKSLEQVVSRSTYEQVAARLETAGIPLEPLKRFKPWMLAITLLGLEWQKAGFDPSLGLDQHFYDQAKVQGKAVQGLETLDYQVSRFDEMTMEQQDRMLAETIKELDTESSHLNELAAAWKTGDVATIERIVLNDVKGEQELYDRLLVERNRNWLPKIEALFARPGASFVVVGAAHLVGPDGLLQMLKSKGYLIEQR